MHFDDILTQYLGEIGLYQIILMICVGSVGINVTFDVLDYLFIAAVPDYRCDVGNITHLYNNLTLEQISRLVSPPGDDGELDFCSMYVRNYTSMTVKQALTHTNNSIVVPCSKWIFSEDQFTSTITSKWELVCDREWLIATSQAAFQVGFLTVSLGGWLSDRIGRRKVALSAMCIHVIFRIAQAFSVNYYMFVICRFFLAVAALNWYTVSFFIIIEIVGQKWRVLAGQLSYFFWSVGYMILGSIAYFIRDWRTLTLVLTVFTVPFLLHLWWLPESIRWLHSKRKTKEVKKVMEQMAKINKTMAPPDEVFFTKTEANDKQAKLKDLFTSFRQIQKTLILCTQWTSLVFVVHGLVYYMPKLGGNIYVNTVLSGALELPALLYVQLTLNTRLGRRLNTIILLITGGVILMMLMFIPKENTWTIISLAMIGRFTNTAALSTMYIYTAELYPTLVRSVGLTLCSTMGRIGGIASPYVILLGKISPFFVPTLMGIVSIIAGGLAILLPETGGKHLPETFNQVGKSYGPTDEHQYKSKHDAEDYQDAMITSV